MSSKEETATEANFYQLNNKERKTGFVKIAFFSRSKSKIKKKKVPTFYSTILFFFFFHNFRFK